LFVTVQNVQSNLKKSVIREPFLENSVCFTLKSKS
jgi:hypothetical protein